MSTFFEAREAADGMAALPCGDKERRMMRHMLQLVSALLIVSLIGCSTEREAQMGDAGERTVGKWAGAEGETADETAVGGKKAEADAAAGEAGPSGDAVGRDEQGEELPACDASEFAYEGYEVMATQYADLDNDGTDECIIACQSTRTDDLDIPQEPAYFELAKWNGEEWADWFGIPAPGGEEYVDENSIIAGDDLNEDGVVELVLQYYGFGVSGRPENVYVWQVDDAGLEEAVEGGSIDTTSDDGIWIEDVTEDYPGREIAVARAVMGSEAHAAPHRYEVTVYCWSDGLYRPKISGETEQTHPTPDSALEQFFGP